MIFCKSTAAETEATADVKFSKLDEFRKPEKCSENKISINYSKIRRSCNFEI